MLVGWPQMNRWRVIRNAGVSDPGPGKFMQRWRAFLTLARMAWITRSHPGLQMERDSPQVIQVRHLRRITVAAIEQAEVWAKAHPDAVSACISLYSRSTDMETVSGFAELPGTANSFRHKVAALRHLGMEVWQRRGDSTG